MLNSPILGYAHHKIVVDDSGAPVDYEFLEVNSTFERLTGLNAKNLIGRTVREAIPGIEKAGFNWIGFYGEIALNGGEKEFEQYSEALGKWYRVHVYSPERMTFTTMFVDITTNKNQADELEAFFSLDLDLLCIADLSGNFIKTNEAWNRVLGYATEDLNKRKFLDFVHPDDLPATLDAMTSLAHGDEVLNFTNRYRSRDGSYRHIEWRSHPKGNLIYASARDVTDKMLVEEKLRDANQMLHAVMDNIPQHLMWKDRNSVYLGCNARTAKIVGLSDTSEIVEKTDYDMPWKKEEADFFRESDQRVIQSGKAELHIIEPQLQADGKNAWLDTTKVPLFAASGEVNGILVSFEDITERMQAQESLKQRERLLRDILESTLSGYWDWDLSKNTEYLSPTFKRMFGYEDHELPNSPDSWQKIIFPEDLPPVLELFDRHVKSRGQVPFSSEVRYRHKDGSTIWVICAGRVVEWAENGSPLRMVGCHVDITQRKRVEEDARNATVRFALAAKAGNVGVWDYDVVQNRLLWDEQMYSLYGITSDAFAGVYEAWRSGLHPDDIERGDREIALALKGERDFNTEFRVVWPDGSTHHIRALATVIRDPSGKPIRMVGTNWDITKQKTNEEALKLAKEQAEAASRVKSEFLANMSHEIRTPLNGVIGFTDLLKSTPLSSVQQQYVDNANVSGHTLLGIINDILDFSKIEAGMLHLELIQTDMVELLENSVDIVKYAAGRKHLELLLNIDRNMPRFAIVDPIRLRQILANLMGNAVKFTERGEVELKLVYASLPDRKGRLSFIVRDTGVGISDEQKEKLFKAFSQADNSTTRKFGGTGLGLIISELIARKMGASIQVSSKLGEGATFSFDIIAATEDGERIEYGPIENVQRCLIIDDNANNRMILEHMLAGWSIACESCDNGLTALKLLEASAPFDVVICDYHMPYIDGLETIRMIRDKLKLTPGRQPVILLHSSSDDAELHRKCDELGVRFRLTKPVKSIELHSFLRQVCAPRADLRQAAEAVAAKRPPSGAKGEGVKILIAEDVAMNMLMIKAMIAKALPGAELIEADNGLETVTQYRRNLPDLVFMDVQMPELDGLDATRRIRELEQPGGRHALIIALTAGAFKEEQDKCLAAGMDGFLTKPIVSEKIAAVLREYSALLLRNQDSPHFDLDALRAEK